MPRNFNEKQLNGTRAGTAKRIGQADGNDHQLSKISTEGLEDRDVLIDKDDGADHKNRDEEYLFCHFFLR
jgi:hypothetical protein